ncbi:MAG: class I SAM-dependent methyltransferase [bacterium]|nr:class I SAM-dependent methyltransferase [bacterium]
MKNQIHEANRKRWDAAAPRWAECADNRGVWKRCPQEPELVLCQKELKHLGDLSGKQVCVLGSGDNQVVFALAGLGAKVTSVDISQNQLDNAAERAKTLGLDIEFVHADVTDLACLGDASFDVVYTGGHVAVWVADLRTYYAEAARILRPGGLFIVNEYHPFRRVWKESTDSLVIEYPYFERGPFEFDLDNDVLYPEPGDLKSYEFHWTISDYLSAVMATECALIEVDEYGEEVGDWEVAPMQGLPEFLLIMARK